jgi:hypothetical protein
MLPLTRSSRNISRIRMREVNRFDGYYGKQYRARGLNDETSSLEKKGRSRNQSYFTKFLVSRSVS